MQNFLKLSVFTLLVSINLFARSLDDIKASGEIIIAVYENFPPYSFMQNDEPKGIDIELGKRIAESLDVKPKFNFAATTGESLADDLRINIWKGNTVHKNKADIMLRVPYDYDYLRLTDKSTGALQNDLVTIKSPYQSEKWIVATHKETIPKINTLAIFAYQTVGVEVDTLPDLHLSAFANGLLRKNIKHYTKFDEAIKDFKEGKIDSITGLKSQLEYLLDYKNNQDKYYFSENIPQMKSQWDIGVAASSNYKDLSYHIDNLINDAYSNNQLKEIFGSFNVEYLPPISKTQ
jgi:ABC-type amino acid transport substrate-binding protein